MNAPAVPLPDRVTIETLLVELVACLRAAEFHAVADAVEVPLDDAVRAAALHDQTDRVPVTGRQIYFRTAMPWAARALEAWSSGEPDEAMRWAKLARYELERYRETPIGESQ